MDYNRNMQHSPSDDEDRMLPCVNYVNGYCVQGGRCRFYHPPTGQVNNSIRCPPLPTEFGSPPPHLIRRHSNSNVSPAYQPYPGSSNSSRLHLPPPPPVDFYPTPSRQTNCFFGQEPDVSMYTVSNASFGRRRSQSSFEESGDDGEGERTYLPHGITATTKNGLVTYTYPNQNESPMPPVASRSSSEGLVEKPETTMFTHINWNEFLIPGFPIPPLVDVPLQDINEPLDDYEGHGYYPGYFAQYSDVPPEGSQAKALSVKEEFRRKIKILAMKSIAEKAQQTDTLGHVRSLDSFFRNYDKLESLPAEMIERRQHVTMVVHCPLETRNLPDLPEVEEGELDSSEYEGSAYLDLPTRDRPENANDSGSSL